MAVSSDDAFNDGMDTSLSVMAESVETAAVTNPNKRKRLEAECPEKKFDDASIQFINLLDPEKKLCIHEYLYDSKDDILVVEYVEKMKTINFIPDLPSADKICVTSTTTTTITKDTACAIANNFMCFFQTRYSRNNLLDAIANEKAVFNLYASLKVPCFQLTPQKHLDRTTAIKSSATTQIQFNATESLYFVSQLLFIRSAHLIWEEVKKTVVDPLLLKSEVQNHLNVHFVKSKMEFLRKFKVEIIDFSLYKSKLIHSESDWRRRKAPPPQQVRSFYAKELSSRISAGKESFNAANVKQEFLAFMEEGQKNLQKVKEKYSSKSNNHDKIPAPQGSDTNEPSTSQNSQRPPHPSLPSRPPQQNWNNPPRQFHSTEYSGNYRNKRQKFISRANQNSFQYRQQPFKNSNNQGRHPQAHPPHQSHQGYNYNSDNHHRPSRSASNYNDLIDRTE